MLDENTWVSGLLLSLGIFQPTRSLGFDPNVELDSRTLAVLKCCTNCVCTQFGYMKTSPIRIDLRTRKWRLARKGTTRVNDEVILEVSSRPTGHQQIEKQPGTLACGSQKHWAGLTTRSPGQTQQKESQLEPVSQGGQTHVNEEQHNIQASILAMHN